MRTEARCHIESGHDGWFYCIAHNCTFHPPESYCGLNAPELVDSDQWCTPRDLAQALGWFDMDPCSNPRSHILAHNRYQLEAGDDGLRDPWFGRVWLNWPYSQPLPWAKRLQVYLASGVVTSAVILAKLDPTTEWYARVMRAGGRSYPLRHRCQYEKPDRSLASPPWPATLIYCNEIPSAAIQERVWLP